MHRRWTRALALVSIGLMSAVSATEGSSAFAAPAVEILGTNTGIAVPGRYIVALKDTQTVRAEGVTASANGLTSRYGGKVRFVYKRTMSGFSVEMSEAEARRLAADPQVAYVEQDQEVHLADTQENPPSWGLDRVDQRNLPLDTTYTHEVHAGPRQAIAYTIDTGIRATHVDFGGRAEYGRDFIDGDNISGDCHGHGTSVAGTIGGQLYGVAKTRVKAIIAYRAFDCAGISTTDSIQRAVEDITSFPLGFPVVNMSIGIQCKTQSGQPAPCPAGTATSLKNAITTSIAAGVTYVIAAGNANLDACGAPLNSIQGAVRVGATTITDSKYPTSNWGSCIDLWAPGENIISAGHTSDTAGSIGSSTSIAAAHVTGAVALIMDRSALNRQTPAQLKAQLLAETTPNVLTGLPGTSPNKLLHTSPPPIGRGSPLALARQQDGRLTLFGVNPDGAVAFRSQTQANSNTWSGWTQSVNPGWYSVCADTDNAARVKLGGLQRSQAMFHRSQAEVNKNGFTGWQPFDGAITSCAVAFDGTKLTVFGTTPQGTVLKRSETAPQGPYTAWGQVLTTPPGVRSVAAERNGNGLVELFGLTGTGQIWHCWETASNCVTTSGSGWVQLDGELSTIALARNQSGALTVFGVNAAGKLFRRDAGPGTNVWAAWQELDAAPEPELLPRSVAAETNADGRITLVMVDLLGHIWQRTQTAPNGPTYGPWTQIDGQLRP